MELDLRQSIKNALYGLSLTYLLFLFIALLGTSYLNIAFHQRLATSFELSARNSLVTSDLREAVAILNPSVNSGFESVSFFSHRGPLVFALPAEASDENEKDRALWIRKIEFKISSESSNEPAVTSRLVFKFNLLPALAEAFSFWLAFLAFAYPLFLRLKKNIEQRHFEILKTKSTALLINQAHQLAHDIRSPLVTLEMAMNDANSLPEEQRLLVQTATVRIRDIANDLLNRHKTGVPSQEETPSLYSIEFLLDQIVAEKRAQFRNRPEVEIEASMPGQIQPSLARLSASDFGRVLSNLINNAIEATKEGTIRVALISNADNSIISIQDSGCGIPSEVLKQLGSHKISHGKTGQESGSGLGVLHAKNCVESWGGNFRH